MPKSKRKDRTLIEEINDDPLSPSAPPEVQSDAKRQSSTSSLDPKPAKRLHVNSQSEAKRLSSTSSKDPTSDKSLNEPIESEVKRPSTTSSCEPVQAKRLTLQSPDLPHGRFKL